MVWIEAPGEFSYKTTSVALKLLCVGLAWHGVEITFQSLIVGMLGVHQTGVRSVIGHVRAFLLADLHHLMGQVPSRLRIGLFEDYLELRGQGRSLHFRHHPGGVFGNVPATPLQRRIQEHIPNDVLDARVSIAGDRVDLIQAPSKMNARLLNVIRIPSIYINSILKGHIHLLVR